MKADHHVSMSTGLIALHNSELRARVKELEAGHVRLQTIVDEAYGPEPALSMDELLTIVERHAAESRQMSARMAECLDIDVVPTTMGPLLEAAASLYRRAVDAEQRLVEVESERDKAQADAKSFYELITRCYEAAGIVNCGTVDQIVGVIEQLKHDRDESLTRVKMLEADQGRADDIILQLRPRVKELERKLNELLRADGGQGFCAALLDVIGERDTALARVKEFESNQHNETPPS